MPKHEPDRQISRIRLSDKSSRLRPRHVVPKRGQAYEPEVPRAVRFSPARGGRGRACFADMAQGLSQRMNLSVMNLRAMIVRALGVGRA